MWIHIFCLVIFSLTIDGQFIKFRIRPNDKGPKCNCVLPQMCGDDDVIINGHGLLDPRVTDSTCPKYNEICCENPIEENDIEGNGKESQPEITTAEIRCGISTVKPIKTRMTLKSRITEFGELPWNLLILENMSANQKSLYRCGATLIHPKVVLTAAHCVSQFYLEPEKLTVRAGEWDTNNLDEPLPYQDSGVEEIVIHPHYNYKSLKNDIALLFLNNPFVLADNVGIICIPYHGLQVAESNCLASGWGRENFKTGKFSNILKKIELVLVVRNKCLEQLRNTRLGRMFNLHRSFLCAGGEKNKDTCTGDGGGPLICPIYGEEEKRFVQSGIVSWGIGCGEHEVPGVYVNVALYSDWIDQEMIDRDLDISLYRF